MIIPRQENADADFYSIYDDQINMVLEQSGIQPSLQVALLQSTGQRESVENKEKMLLDSREDWCSTRKNARPCGNPVKLVAIHGHYADVGDFAAQPSCALNARPWCFIGRGSECYNTCTWVCES
ncbi:uncharacterized protein LOC108208421 isoform X2 [Daucus carota subsp. sativus]